MLGKGWLRRFRLRHLEIATRKSQGLEVNRARALCPTVAKTFYSNLEELYMRFHYLGNHIWNYDKRGVHARRSGGTTKLAKWGSRSMHSIEPDQREHLSILSCINVDGGYIPNFYILKRTYFLEDYIAGCEDGAMMGITSRKTIFYDNFVSFWMCHSKNLYQFGRVIPNIHITLDHFPITLDISCHFGQCHKRPCILLVYAAQCMDDKMVVLELYLVLHRMLEEGT